MHQLVTGQLAMDPQLKIACHKSCVPTCTSSHHLSRETTKVRDKEEVFKESN